MDLFFNVINASSIVIVLGFLLWGIWVTVNSVKNTLADTTNYPDRVDLLVARVELLEKHNLDLLINKK